MQVLTVDRVPDFVRDLRAGQPERTLELDLRGLRLHADAASLLSSVLLGPLGDRKITVHITSKDPGERTHPRPNIQLEILFALANRRGSSRFAGHSQPGRTDSEWTENFLLEWRNAWTPGGRTPWRQLFAEPDKTASPPLLPQNAYDELFPDIFGRHSAAFINPHLGSGRTGRSDLNQAISSWMSRVLPDFNDYTKDPELRKRFVTDVGSVVEELVENVRDWASLQVDRQPSRCLVRVFVTRASDFDRLYLTILDTGPGILATTRGRCAEMHPEALFRGLLTGSLVLARARGFGLPLLWRAITRWPDSDLWLFSGQQLITGRGGVLHHQRLDVDAPGTLFRVMFRLPK